jgi:Na+-driven multidrug efflux pump
MDYTAAVTAKKANPTKSNRSLLKEQAVLKPWLDASFSVGTTLLKLGFVMATIVASLASVIPARYGRWLTTDTTVQHAVQPLAKYLWAGAFLTAPVAVSEGILLARRELQYLATVYVLTTALLPPALIRVKILGGNVEQVWACFAVFQLFRAALFAGRIWSGSIWKGISSLVFGTKYGSNNPPNDGKIATT